MICFNALGITCISNTCYDYSLRVLLYLSQMPKDTATITEISDFYNISENHLVKVVQGMEAFFNILDQYTLAEGSKITLITQITNHINLNSKRHT